VNVNVQIELCIDIPRLRKRCPLRPWRYGAH